jgi:hypothetical protein
VNIIVKAVEIGAQYEGKIYDYWITGQTLSGKCIKIFDSVPFDVRKDIGKKINCLLLAGFLKAETNDDTGGNVITGNFIGDYEIPVQVLKVRHDVREKKWLAAETCEGIVLFNAEDLKVNSLPIGEKVCFSVGRFDLIGIE